MTWAEVIRKLKAAGFVAVRSGKGSHLLLKHPVTGKEVWVAVHHEERCRTARQSHPARGGHKNDNALPDRP